MGFIGLWTPWQSLILGLALCSGAGRAVKQYSHHTDLKCPCCSPTFNYFPFHWCIKPCSSKVLNTSEAQPCLWRSIFHSCCQHKALLDPSAEAPISLLQGLFHAHLHNQLVLPSISPDTFLSASDTREKALLQWLPNKPRRKRGLETRQPLLLSPVLKT